MSKCFSVVCLVSELAPERQTYDSEIPEIDADTLPWATPSTVQLFEVERTSENETGTLYFEYFL